MFSGIGKGISSLFGGGDSPSQAASPYYQQLAPEMKEAYKPYIDQGQEALTGYQDQINRLLSDPSAVMQMAGQGYTESPGFQHNVQSATDAAMRAAAAGGEAGAPSVQEALASQISGMASQDYGDYMNRALGLYGAGLSGEGGLGQMGFQASTDLAQNLANALMSQGNLAASGAQAQQQGMMNLLGGLGQAGIMSMFL